MGSKKRYGDIQWKGLVGLLIIMLGVVFFWNTWIVYPLKILVVFFHELSHGLMAVITGGTIREIRLVAAQGGVCVTAGGNQFLTISAGYLGSLTMGGIILVLAARTRHDKFIVTAIGGLIVFISLLFIRPIVGFGFLFCLCAGLALIAAGKLLSGGANDFLLKLIGLTSCLYAVLDIKSDILDRPHLMSDAHMLAELTHLPTLFWGLVWIIIAMVAAVGFLWVASRRKAHHESTTTRRKAVS